MFLALLIELVLSEIILDCPESLCPSEFRGDGICDTGCMLPACNYDSLVSSDSAIEQYEKSDCKADCKAVCRKKKLGDGTCNDECNVEECGWDLGDCGYCAKDCKVEDLELNPCKERCLTVSCRFGNGECGWCAENCFKDDPGNGVCNESCLISECDFDSDDCPLCEEGCEWSMVGNGVCEDVCNVSECDMDGSDCLCGDNCTLEMKNSTEECFEACNTKDCDWQNGFCGFCASGCFQDMIENNVCDPECFNKDCNYDNDKCGCNKECPDTEAGNCKYGCMLTPCNYDDGCSCGSSCNPGFRRLKAIVHHIISQDFDSIYDPDLCETSCSDSDLLDGYDFVCRKDKCQTDECLHQLGGCSKPEDCPADCKRCSNVNSNLCFVCENKKVNRYGSCVDECGVALVATTLCLGENDNNCSSQEAVYCLPETDTSTESNPRIIKVDPNLKDPAPNKPPPENKFKTLNEALDNVWNEYTEIELTVNGTHELSELEDIEDPRFNGVNLTIRSKGANRATIELISNKVRLPSGFRQLVLKNLSIDGSRALNQDCEQDTCKYCPFVEEINSVFYNDKNKEVNPNDYNVERCRKTESNMLVKATYPVTIRNCMIKEFRYESYGVIEIKNGSVEITDSEFANVIVDGSDEEAVIKVLCSSNDCDKTFVMKDSTVSYVNNGFEYTDFIRQNGFAKLDSLYSVTFSNVTFANNVFLCDLDLNCKAFIEIKAVKEINVTGCKFENNFLMSSLLYISQNQLAMATASATEDGKCQECGYVHFSLVDNQFLRSATTVQFIRFEEDSFTSNIEIINNEFEEVLTMMSLIHINKEIPYTDVDLNGGNESFTVDGEKTLLYADPKFATISGNKLTNTVAKDIIYIASITNTQITDLEVTKLLEARDLNYIIETYFQDDDKMYMKFSLDPLEVSFNHYISANAVGNFEVNELKVDEIECSTDACLLYLTEMLEEIVIKNMSVADKGPLIEIESSLKSSNLTLENVTFQNVLTGNNVGLVSISSVSKILFNNVVVRDVDSEGTGSFKIERASELEISNSLFEKAKSSKGNGGAIYVTILPDSESHIAILNSNFTECSADIRAGAVYITATTAALPVLLTVEDSHFLRNTASSASILYISDSVNLNSNSYVKNSVFSDNIAHSVGGFATYHSAGVLLVQDSVFSGNSGKSNSLSGTFNSNGLLLDLKNVTFSDNKGEMALAVTSTDSSSQVNTEDCKFFGNGELAFGLITSTWHDKGSSFENNVRAINLQLTGYAYLTDTSVQHNQGGSIGVVFQVSSSVVVECQNCLFIENSSDLHGGAMTVESYSKVTLRDCKFENNLTKSKGSAISFSNNVDESLIQDTEFLENNSASGGTLNIVDSKVRIKRSVFSRNTADSLSPGILSNSGSIIIEDSSFSSQSGDSGVYLFVTTESSINVKNSTFSDGEAKNGGMITLASSSLNFDGSSIKNCQSETKSGGIFANNDAVVNIFNSTFENIKGENGHILCDDGVLTVNSSSFVTLPDGGITVTTMDELVITNSKFEDSSGNTKGRGIRGDNIDKIQIESTTFSGLQASEKGGAVYFFGTITSTSSSYIKDCFFIDNSASSGGAIHLSEMCIPILRNTFTRNSASDSGGAIFANCPYTIEITDNVFDNNNAIFNGGGIYWIDQQPIIDRNTFSGNSAEYGDNYASFPVSIRETSRRLSSEDSGEVASGQLLTPPLILGVFDHYGQIVTTANDTESQIVAGENATLSGDTQQVSIRGIFNFSDVYVTAEPNSTVDLTISSTSVSISTSASISNLTLSFHSRDCVQGEYFFNNECIKCLPETYSLDPLNPCEDCPSEAKCYGGADMAPKPGYWRKNNNTDDFFKCNNEDACLGGLKNDYGNFEAIGNCSEGYRGHLCQPCDNGYSATSKYRCGKCPEDWANALILTGLIMLVIGLCFVMVRSSLRSVYQPKALHSIYLKIFVNYLQLVMLTAQFRLDWPEEVVRLLDIQDQSGRIADQLFSFDCFLATENDDSYTEIFYFKLILMALLPFILCIFAVIFWGIYSCVKKDRLVLKQELITTMCVVFFLVHPTLTRLMFSMFSCMNIEGEYWLIENLDIKCWDERHVSNSLMIGLPAIVVWVIGIPTFILVHLTKRKRMLKKTSERLKFGFLYNGYRLDHFYWEFVILYRKILIICCAVFLSSVSIPIQALVCFTILVFCLHVQYKVKPFDRKELNEMEIRAIIVATVTIYCGLYYLTQDLSGLGKYIFLSVIIFANVYFLVLWIYYICYAGLIAVSRFVPYLKYRLKDVENIDRPLISLLKASDDYVNEKALDKILNMNSSLDFYSMIMRKRMKNKDGTNFETQRDEPFDKPVF